MRCCDFGGCSGFIAFFYAVLHFTTYMWFDKWFDVAAISEGHRQAAVHHGWLRRVRAADSARRDVAESDGRRNSGAGGRRCTSAIYLIAALAILHFWWMRAGKHDLFLPKTYGAIMVALLGWRLSLAARTRMRSPARRRKSDAPRASLFYLSQRLQSAGRIGSPANNCFVSSRSRTSRACSPIDHHFGGARPRVVVRAHHEAIRAGRADASRSPGSTASSRSRPSQSPLSQTGPTTS